jgi:hypothetical protein
VEAEAGERAGCEYLAFFEFLALRLCFFTGFFASLRRHDLEDLLLRCVTRGSRPGGACVPLQIFYLNLNGVVFVIHLYSPHQGSVCTVSVLVFDYPETDPNTEV